MMPLLMAETGAPVLVKKLGGSPEQRQHLQDLGLVPGREVTVLVKNGGSLIVRLKESRLALSQDLALKIMI